MLSDPQTVTISAVAQNMPRVSTDKSSSTYQKADGTHQVVISHQKQAGGRIQSLARITKKAIVPDPITAVNDEESFSISVIIDRPLAGFSSADVDAVVVGFKTWLSSTVVGQLYGQEH